MAAAPDALRARDRLLFDLKRRGAQTAGELAARLGVTAVAVRQHLVALEAEGLVGVGDMRRGVGRPAQLWALTADAAARFPDTHAELTVEILGAVRTALGDDALERVVSERTRQQREAYAAGLPDGAALAERVRALAELRDAEGYMAECRPQPDGSLLLVENHCPICAAARACTGICAQELGLFRDVLGARVERTEHVLDGARRCAYRIEESSLPGGTNRQDGGSCADDPDAGPGDPS